MFGERKALDHRARDVVSSWMSQYLGLNSKFNNNGSFQSGDGRWRAGLLLLLSCSACSFSLLSSTVLASFKGIQAPPGFQTHKYSLPQVAA